MLTGILVPMPEEIELILHYMKVEEIVHSGMRDYYVGSLQDKKVVVALSRIGKVASAATAAFLITHFKIDQMIVVGVAGAAKSKVKIGDICIATASMQHDMDARGLYPQYEIPLLNTKKFVSDPILVSKAKVATAKYLKNRLFNEVDGNIINDFKLNNIQVYEGLLASGDQFIASKKKLNILKKGIPNLLFVEMEGAAVAQICFEYYLPLLNIRIISDNANDNAHIDFGKFVEKAAKILILGIITEFLSD